LSRRATSKGHLDCYTVQSKRKRERKRKSSLVSGFEAIRRARRKEDVLGRIKLLGAKVVSDFVNRRLDLLHNWKEGVEHRLANLVAAANSIDVVYGGLESRLRVEEILV